MVYMYLDIRYKKQLEEIARPFIYKIIYDIQKSITTNGGVILREKSAFFAAFDETSIGGVCAVFFCINSILHMYAQNEKKLGEYTFLIENSTENEDDVFEYMQNQAIRMLSDAGVFCFAGARTLLKEYFTFSDDLPAQIIINPTELSGSYTAVHNTEKSELIFPLLYNYTDSPVRSMRNTLGLFPLEKIFSHASDEQKKELTELQYVVRTYECNRFAMKDSDELIYSMSEYFYRSMIAARNYYYTVHKRFSFYTNTENANPLLEKMSTGFTIRKETNLPSLSEAVSNADINMLPSDIRDVLYIMYRCEDFLFPDEIDTFFEYMGKSGDFVTQVLAYIADSKGCSAVIEKRGEKYTLSPSQRKTVEENISVDAKKLDSLLGSYLWKEYQAGNMTVSIELYTVLTVLRTTVPDAFMLSALYHFLEQLQDSSDLKKTEQVLFKKMTVLFDVAEKIRRILYCRQSSISGYESISGTIDSYYFDADKGSTLFDTAILLECAKWYYCIKEFSKATVITKKALVQFQEQKNKDGEFRCFSLLALLNLAYGNIVDSETYFEYASEVAEYFGDASCVLKVHFDLAVVYFIEGNYARCLHRLFQLQNDVGNLFMSDWEIIILFLQGRCYLELGNYESAETIFTSACSIAKKSGMNTLEILCRIWYGRSLMYTGRSIAAEKIFTEYKENFPDALLFSLENNIIRNITTTQRNDMEDTIFLPEMIEKTAKIYETQTTWFSEQSNLNSGFNIVEDRTCINKNENSIGSQLLRTFYAVYKSDSHALSLLSRDESTSATDPYNYIYSFLLYMCRCAGSTHRQLDQMTLLSKSFKLLQKRANHIDEISIRAEFLKNSFWISRLYAEAKRHMLI